MIFKDYIAPAVPWILVILGWVFVSRDQNRRETRKETRAALDSVESLLHILHEKSTFYLCKIRNVDDKNEAIEQEIAIKRAIDLINVKLISLTKIDERFGVLETEFGKYGDLVTGNSKFESRSENHIYQSDNDKIYEIALQLKRILEKMQETYATVYIN